MKNLKRLIILVVVGVLALSTLVLSACGSDLDYEVEMNEVKIEEVVKDGETFGCLVAYGQTDKNAKQYGFKIIYSNTLSMLNKFEVVEIKASGCEFDPAYHHAVLTEHDESKPAGVVLEVLQKGYMYKDRVIRPAMVKVNE